MGDDAKALASQICETKVVSNTGGLRVRGEASEEGTILTAMGEGQKATLDNEAEAVEGWIAVNYYGKKGYVNAQYATIDTTYSTAITLAEEQEILEAQKKAAEQKQASYSQGAAVAASYDDVTLLAALIQCEGGNQPYEGQVGIGAVVVNRLHSGRYGSSISAVIYAPHQFGPAGTGAVARVAAAGPKASCMQAAQDALNGVSTVGGCTHFHRANGREGIVIGAHVFF
jgi:spore germination cell wall hydrolase CwlJ-like protein